MRKHATVVAGFLLLWGVMPSAAAPTSPGITVGFCTEDVEKARAAGFDYVELGVRNFAALSDPEFEALLRRRRRSGIPTPVGYLFLPGDLKVAGPHVDPVRQLAYVRTAFARAERLGIEFVVFGSGPARTVPDGFSKQEAFRQLVDFARRISPEARRHKIVLGVEAQRKEETNVINSLAEALQWVEAVDDPNFQLIVDFYHLAMEKEDPTILLKAGKRIRHVHFANPVGRVFPRDADEFDYSGFFENLRRIGYRGRISIEARTEDLAADAPKAIAFLRAAAAAGVRPPAAAVPQTPVQPASAGADEFVCTEVIGVSVTGDWFGAGFEEGIDGDRWQVRWRKQAFLDQWADPGGDPWKVEPQSRCTRRSDNPDRVLFTGVHWEYKTREEWERGFAAVVGTIRTKYPGVRRIELLTMLRGPGNETCGSPMTVVQPYIDDAIERVASRFPGLVVAGPRVETKTCDVFTKGGPHFTEPGMGEVARLYRQSLEPSPGPKIAFPGQYAPRLPEWKYPAWPRGCGRFEGAERVACLEFVAFDFGGLARYAAANTALAPAKPSEKRVIFYGDSITDNWSKPTYGGFFPGRPYVNRGIGGQTTSQMLLRFRADVIAAKPSVIVILAGTNDIAGNAGPVAVETVQGNLATMAELAQLHGIRVVLASVLPIADDKKDATGQPLRRSVDRPPAAIEAMNRWLADYSRANGHVYLDYFSALVDGEGRLKAELNDDGLHPNAAGYALMAPLAEKAIARALEARPAGAP